MPRVRIIQAAGLTLAFLFPGLVQVRSADPDPRGVEFFEKRIRPVLVEHCHQCHSAEADKAKKLRGGLRLDTRDGLRKGGDSGPAIVAGKPDDSLLLKALRHDGDLKMPPKSKLPDTVLADFTQWVRLGATDPRDGVVASAARVIDIEAGKKYWAFQPLAVVAPAVVRNQGWVRNPVNRFILAKLEEKGLTPNAPVSREKLIRRAYFDLHGLPPTPAEIDAFLNDSSPDAYERLVERLLQSERYGERWGRHWLDVVRYAESGGYEFDKDRPGAYHYRDFVIKALNQDLPFDEFVRLQIAGDHLKPGDLAATAATGFLVAGPFPGQTTVKTLEPIRYDHLDDMLSTIGSSLLGLSLGCARCHDHKYDPIPQADYYHLLACLARTDSADVKFTLDGAAYEKAKAAHDREHAPLAAARDKFAKDVLPGRLSKWLEAHKDGELDKPKAELRALLQKPEEKRVAKEKDAILKLYRALDAEANRVYTAAEEHAKKAPKPNQMSVFAASSGKGGDVYHLTRGEVGRKNGMAKPGFVQVLMAAPQDAQRWLPAAPAKGARPTEPRVALASWLTDTEAGAGQLLARVIVNRLWQHHFGKGIVRTPNDFGAQGERPTHPELLDWLAAELIRNGWKLKPLHRLLMTSAVYAQGGAPNTVAQQVDPQNRLWWRVPPRRLEAEAIRDALLAVSGTLDLTLYGPGTLDENSNRRSVYLTVKRSRLPAMMMMYDSPEPIQSIGERQTTTVATQALAMLNSSFVRQRAERLAQRVRPKTPDGLPAAVEEAYRLTLSRRPTDAERARMLTLLQGNDPSALADVCQVLLCLNEFVYVD